MCLSCATSASFNVWACVAPIKVIISQTQTKILEGCIKPPRVEFGSFVDKFYARLSMLNIKERPSDGSCLVVGVTSPYHSSTRSQNTFLVLTCDDASLQQ